MQVFVKVPATSANLGPGFDCLGMALGLYNEFTFTKLNSVDSPPFEIEIVGEGASEIPRNEENLVIQAMHYFCEHVGCDFPHVQIKQVNHVPSASGLGSSSTAVIAGMLGINTLVGNQLSLDDILQLATDMEGHPDNVAPALFGNLILVPPTDDGTLLHIEKLEIHPMRVVIVLPDFELLTADARAALPQTVSRADAVFNVSRLPLVMQALQQGDYAKLNIAMFDRLHQPYRMALIPGMESAFAAARAAGASAVAISGAGPSLIAFAPDNLDIIGQAAQDAYTLANLTSRRWILPADKRGAIVQIIRR